MAEPTVTVVLPTRDRPQRLARNLPLVVADCRPGDEVLVVDSASSTTETAEVARAAGVRCLRVQRPGASLARNVGWRAAANAVVAFVDDDCRVLPGWVDALRTAFHDGGTDFVLGRVDVPPDQHGVEHPVGVRTDEQPAPVDRHSVGTLGGTNNFACRTGALAAVGGFDERLGPATWFASAEDVDLVDRLLAAGFGGRYVPDALVLHEQWRTRSQLLRLDWAYGKGQGGRLAKLARADRERYRRLRAEVLWRQGAVAVAGDLRRRYEFGAVAGSVRTAGTLFGFAVGAVALNRRPRSGERG